MYAALLCLCGLDSNLNFGQFSLCGSTEAGENNNNFDFILFSQ